MIMHTFKPSTAQQHHDEIVLASVVCGVWTCCHVHLHCDPVLHCFSFAEIMVLIMFTLLAFAWMTRDPAFFPGWGNLPFLEPG